MKRFGLAVLVALVACVVLVYGQTCNGTTTICVSQSGTGVQDGTTGAPWSMTKLNTVGSWNGGGADLDAGETAYLTGTITSAVTVAGSGSSGNVITIDGSNATMANSAEHNFNAKSYVTLKNFHYSDSGSGAGVTITGDHNTIDGYRAVNWTGSFGFQHNPALGNSSESHSTFNTIRNSYLISTATNQHGQYDMTWFETGNNALIEGNYYEHKATCDGTVDTDCHDDIVQMFQGCGGCGGGAYSRPHDVTIRYNKFVLDTPINNNKSLFMNEATGGTNYVYGNQYVCVDGADSANGFHTESGSSVTWYFLNNSFLAKAGTCENTITFTGSGTLRVANNIVRSGASTRWNETMTQTCDHNSWSGGGGGSCSGTGDSTAAPLFTTETGTADLTLQALSPAKGAGLAVSNVGGQTFDYGPCSDATWPNPSLCQRKIWDMGAFVMDGVSGGSVPATFSTGDGRIVIRPK